MARLESYMTSVAHCHQASRRDGPFSDQGCRGEQESTTDEISLMRSGAGTPRGPPPRRTFL